MKVTVHHRCDDFSGYRAARVKSLFNVATGANFELQAELDLESAPWQIGVIVGPSGSGKTSMGRALWGADAVYAPSWPADAPIIDAITPEGSFDEVGQFATHKSTLFGMQGNVLASDGVVTGAASVGGRLVHLASQDFTVAGGSAGEVHSIKVADIMKASLRAGSPFVFINDSGGARVQEGIGSLSGYGKVFHANVLLSGAVPQISLICGPCAGGAAYSPALTDFIIQTRQAQMFITGPAVIKAVTGEDVTMEELGGGRTHSTKSGNSHYLAADETDAIEYVRQLITYLPQNNLEDPPVFDEEEAAKDAKVHRVVALSTVLIHASFAVPSRRSAYRPIRHRSLSI